MYIVGKEKGAGEGVRKGAWMLEFGVSYCFQKTVKFSLTATPTSSYIIPFLDTLTSQPLEIYFNKS